MAAQYSFLLVQVVAQRRIHADKFNRLTGCLVKAAPPCLSNAEDWEQGAATLEELSVELGSGAASTLPEPAGRCKQDSNLPSLGLSCMRHRERR